MIILIPFKKNSQDGDTPLTLSVAHNREDCVRVLLREGADPNLAKDVTIQIKNNF